MQSTSTDFSFQWHLVLATQTFASVFFTRIKNKQHLSMAQSTISVTSLHNRKALRKNSTRWFCPFLIFSQLRAVKTLSEQFEFQKFPIASSELTN